MSRSQPRLRIASARSGVLVLLAPFVAAALICGSASAADMKALGEEFWDAAVGGKVHLNMRARYEYADAMGPDASNAFTLRTRLGYGTAAFKGFSAYGDFEYVAALDPAKHYWDVVSGEGGVRNPAGKTPIADPRVLELNQAYLKFERDELKGSSAIGGRQRIILDDHRFIGNVGWRQNEQTYDAVLAKSRLGVEDLEAQYGYIWDVRRIFGGQDDEYPNDTPSSLLLGNFDSESHIINVSYGGIEQAKLAGFIYLLELENKSLASLQFSSATYGLRANGKLKLGDDLGLGYQASYAVQTDYGDNPVSYTAHYVLLEAMLEFAKLGGIGAGYELLGSDDGKARVVTPLATLHKFNGWADVFLDNGGVRGLQDLNFTLAPKLPWKLSGKIVYHYFWGADNGNRLGSEWDILVKRPINKYLDVLAKYAYFNSASGAVTSINLADIHRVWVQVTFKF
jgi:hypothetical protein